jgi:hypothetical protein
LVDTLLELCALCAAMIGAARYARQCLGVRRGGPSAIFRAIVQVGFGDGLGTLVQTRSGVGIAAIYCNEYDLSAASLAATSKEGDNHGKPPVSSQGAGQGQASTATGVPCSCICTRGCCGRRKHLGARALWHQDSVTSGGLGAKKIDRILNLSGPLTHPPSAIELETFA